MVGGIWGKQIRKTPFPICHMLPTTYCIFSLTNDFGKIKNHSAMAKNSKKKITFELDADLRKRLERRAAHEDLDLSKLLRRAIRQFLASPQPEAPRA